MNNRWKYLMLKFTIDIYAYFINVYMFIYILLIISLKSESYRNLNWTILAILAIGWQNQVGHKEYNEWAL